MIDRPVPQAIDAEKAILGAVILDNNTIAEAMQTLRTDHLAVDSHRRIYGAMLALVEDSKPIDMITLAEQLSLTSDLVPCGGVAYIASLTDGVPRRSSVKTYIKTVRDKWVLRQIVSSATALIEQAMSGSVIAEQCLSQAQDQLQELAADDNADMQWVSETIPETMKRYEAELASTDELLGLRFGISTIDRATKGLRDGEFALIAARPGGGKTHVLCESILQNAHRGKQVAIFQMELKKWQMDYRLIQHEAKIPTSFMRDKRQMDGDMRKAFVVGANKVKALPIKVHDGTGLTADKLRAKVAMIVKRDKIDAVYIDYGQLLVTKGKDEVERAVKQARCCDTVARDYCPVFAAAQLNRAPEHNINKWPTMLDLKGSSQWEQDADIIAFIHRPRNKENPEKPLEPCEDVIILEKFREGDGVKVEPVVMSDYGAFVPRTTIAEPYSQPKQRTWGNDD